MPKTCPQPSFEERPGTKRAGAGAALANGPSPAFVKILLGLIGIILLAAAAKFYSSRPVASSPEPMTETAGTETQIGHSDAAPRRRLHAVAVHRLPTAAYPAPPAQAILFTNAANTYSPDDVSFGTIVTEYDYDSVSPLPPNGTPETYRVPKSRAAELQADLNAIAGATNNLFRLKGQFDSIKRDFVGSTGDYLGNVVTTADDDQGARAAAAKKLLDLQGLYEERRRQYELEIAPLKLNLQDNPVTMDRKLTLLQQAADRYKGDMHDLATAINAVRQQTLASKESNRGNLRQMDQAYQQSVRANVQTLSSLTNEVRQQITTANALIEAYNAKLMRYGSQ